MLLLKPQIDIFTFLPDTRLISIFSCHSHKENKWAYFPKQWTIPSSFIFCQSMVNMSFPCTDEIHRCNALQSSSIHHRIDRWEWSCPGGLPPSRITHEPQHDWSLLTTPEPVPYSQSTHILPPPLKVSGNACHFLRWPITTHRGWSALICIPEFSQSYLSEDL